jgi:hypothetical protein
MFLIYLQEFKVSFVFRKLSNQNIFLDGVTVF